MTKKVQQESIPESLDRVSELIRAGSREEAVGLFFSALEQELIIFLTQRFYWSKQEARSLIHDAYLLIEKQIGSGDLQKLYLSYVKRVCQNLGANEYRKLLVKETQYSRYLEEERHKFNNEYLDLYGIEIYPEPQKIELPVRYQKALLAFGDLSDKCRQLLKLRFVDSLDHEEISNRMEGVGSADSSKTMLSRCMKYWRKKIADNDQN